jgi:hypothetical protein
MLCIRQACDFAPGNHNLSRNETDNRVEQAKESNDDEKRKKRGDGGRENSKGERRRMEMEVVEVGSKMEMEAVKVGGSN